VDRAGPLRDYCTGLVAASGRKRGADGSDHGTRANGGAASVIAAFCRSGSLVGWGGASQSAPDGAASDRASWSDQSLDRRRYRLSHEGGAFGWGGAPNTAGNWASRPTARLPCRCHLPTTQQACRWPIGCICRSSRRKITSVGAKQASLRRSASRPSRSLRSSKSRGPVRRTFLTIWWSSGYGNASTLRGGITKLGKLYVTGIQSQTLVSKPSPRRGQAARKGRRDASNAISIKELAVGLRAKAWHTIE
jgi:hypothetical protein